MSYNFDMGMGFNFPMFSSRDGNKEVKEQEKNELMKIIAKPSDERASSDMSEGTLVETQLGEADQEEELIDNADVILDNILREVEKLHICTSTRRNSVKIQKEVLTVYQQLEKLQVLLEPEQDIENSDITRLSEEQTETEASFEEPKILASNANLKRLPKSFNSKAMNLDLKILNSQLNSSRYAPATSSILSPGLYLRS